MTFGLEKNGLGKDARLSLWGSGYSEGNQQMWNGSQANWKKQKTNHGHVILATLRIYPGGAETPSFKLKFNTNRTQSDWVSLSQVLRGKGRQEVSFPANNTHNYSPKSYFVALVAPQHGGSFRLTLKYLDSPGTPKGNCHNHFSVWFLEENSTEFPFTRLTRRCGRNGDVSEPLGNSAVAILDFFTVEGPVGRGFLVEVN